MMPYIFDTNTLIEAKNRYYSFEVCPAFWDWLILERGRGNIVCIEAVKAELEDPDAKTWADSNSDFFLENDDSRMSDVSTWVMAQLRFLPAARATFLSKADPRVISYALARNCAVVTHEVSAPDSKKAVKIPDVCSALGVNCKNSFEVLNELKARFILETV